MIILFNMGGVQPVSWEIMPVSKSLLPGLQSDHDADGQHGKRLSGPNQPVCHILQAHDLRLSCLNPDASYFNQEFASPAKVAGGAFTTGLLVNVRAVSSLLAGVLHPCLKLPQSAKVFHRIVFSAWSADCQHLDIERLQQLQGSCSNVLSELNSRHYDAWEPMAVVVGKRTQHLMRTDHASFDFESAGQGRTQCYCPAALSAAAAEVAPFYD